MRGSRGRCFPRPQQPNLKPLRKMSFQQHKTANAQAMTERRSAVLEKVRELQRETPGMSFETAYAECAKLPEMKSVFDAMQQPAAMTVAGPSPEQKKASAQWAGKVQAAVHQRGISYDAAHEAMKAEEPQLHAAMSGSQGAGQFPKDEVFDATLLPARTQTPHRP